MQIKSTMRYHLTLVRMANINNQQTMCAGKDVEKTLVHSWWPCRLVKPLWKAVRSYLRKLKMELPYDPTIPLLGFYLKKPNTNSKECMHPCVDFCIIYNNQDLEAAKVSISG